MTECYLCRKPCDSFVVERNDDNEPVYVCLDCLEEALRDRA